MNEQKLKKILYSFYVLQTYEKDKKLSVLELNSLMINSLDTIDNDITNKEQLIERINNILKFRINNQTFLTNRSVDFKIGDIIKTSLPSSIIKLKFIFSNNENNFTIDVFENEKQTLKIDL